MSNTTISNTTTLSNSTTIHPNGTSTLWQPAIGSTWNYLLLSPINLITLSSLPSHPSFSIWDIDLFDNPASTISALQSPTYNSSKVICYFSAGTYENWRPDAGDFLPSDLGDVVSGWPSEKWINISSPSVRAIMTKRLDIAVEKGCDGVDPDNMDGYANTNGLGLDELDSINYMDFLANETSIRKLSIGLKNANAIVDSVVDRMQWAVNEQCHEYDECVDFSPFTEQGKPVFNVEYPKGGNNDDNSAVTASQLEVACNHTDAEGFSTIIKNMNLDWFTESCDGVVVSVASDVSGSNSNGAARAGVSVKGICTVAVVFSMLLVNLIT